LSPVIIQEALAETANSRNLSSLGSRQSVIVSNISEKIAITLYSSMMLNLVSREMYLSNLSLTNTSQNSSYVSMLADNCPIRLAFSYASVGFECSERNALTSVFVSITKRLFFIQQLLKDFFCKSIFSSFLSCFFQEFFKLRFFITLRNNFYLFFKTFLKPVFNCRRSFPPFFSGSIVHFNYYAFHNFSFLLFSNLHKKPL